MNNHQKSLSKKLGQAQLNSSTRFNAFQRAGFVTAPSPSQSFGDGVSSQMGFPRRSLHRRFPVAVNVGNC